MSMSETAIIRPTFAARYRKVLLGGLAVVLFFAAWQAVFLVVPFDPLFISKPDLIAAGLVDLIDSGDLFHDLSGSAPPSLSACRSVSSWAGGSASAMRSIR